MAFPIPSMLLKQLYTFGSLANTERGVRFSLKNRLSDGTVTGLHHVKFDGVEAPLRAVRLDLGNGNVISVDELRNHPVDFPLRRVIDIVCNIPPLEVGIHHIEVKFDAKPFGTLTLKVEGAIQTATEKRTTIPRNRDDDYSDSAIGERQHFIEEFSGGQYNHIKQYSFDPHITNGNIEQFVGAVQIPIGLAGPLLIHGEHAEGEFVVPMATTEGTLVASYNRGMKVISLSGGCRVTIAGDGMQRAPVFVFDDALQARNFALWVADNFTRIAEMAEATSSVAKLLNIEPFLASKFAYLRFTYSTGDAAGQNMVGKATLAACEWIVANNASVQRYMLSGGIDTDKKHSAINAMNTRGKRVVAEATIPADLLRDMMRVDPATLFWARQLQQTGAFLARSSNNGAHAANGLAALFMATGQDVANVAESHASIVYTQLLDSGDYYWSITLPALIVATVGGGTGLATQRECLDVLGCSGPGRVRKLAEICAAVVLAGEISLGSAVLAGDWVSSHEKFGRNRG